MRKTENWHEWGANYTNIWSPNINNQGTEANYGGYVEDELPADAEVTGLTIAGFINLPMGLSATDLETQTGGIPSSTIAYQSYVLADYGNGPTYRNSGDSGILKPKAGTGFTLMKQSAGESKTAFKVRVQAQPYQYGIYQDGAGRKTVMIHFGNMKSTGNQQEKLQNQTNQEYSGKTFVDKDGATRQILQFAVEAATATIGDQRSGYTENDRELLERYFTMTYGESNAIGGSIAAYNIGLNVRYPPETSGKIGNNANIYTHSALTLNQTTPERMPKINLSDATLKNPNAYIQLSKTEVMLQKLDADLFTENGDYIGINGAEFKLQKKVGSTWEDVGTPQIFTTADYSYTDDEGEKIIPGIIKIDVAQILGVAGGTLKDTFRFVETKAPAGFSDRDSPNWNNQAQAIVSDEFTLASSTSQGHTVIVWNRHKEVTYKVEHWVQKDGFDGTDTSHFEKVVTEEKHGLAGETVNGQPLDSLQLTHYYNPVFTQDEGVPSGVIPDPSSGEQELILKLYYTKDEVIPFTIYKLGMNEEPLSSTDDHKVRFKAYSFAYKKTSDGTDTTVTSHPPTAKNIQDGYWRRTVIVNENTLAWTTNNADTREELVLTTDSQGRIRDKRFNRDNIGGTIALVEIENSFPDYNPAPTVSEAYWVFSISNSDKVSIVSGTGYGDKSYLKNNYRPEGSTKNQYAIQNKFEVAPKVFKVDENDDPMPSDNRQSVTFDVYEYIGVAADRPDISAGANMKDYNNPLSGTYANNWQKITASPCKTDVNGQIVSSDDKPLNLNPQKVYSFIEKKTHEGYQVPDNQWWSTNRTSHWLVSVSGDLKTGSTGFVDSRPVQFLANMYEKNSEFTVSKEGIYLKNRKLTEVPIFKVDENLNPIRQNSADSFKFETYIFNNTTASDDYKTIPLSDWRWKSVSKDVLADSFNSKGSGQLFTEDNSLETRVGRTEVVKEQIIGIREIKGMHDYVKPDGYWVVKLVWDPIAKVNKVTSIEYFENGELVTGDDNTEYHERLNGEAYLKNSRVPTHDFSFVKENEKQEPLGNVEFALYTERNASGSENPNAVNTRWDITEEPYREAISSTDTNNLGTVTFKDLVAGNYLLLETKTVEGYQLPQGYWVVTMDNQGEVTIRGSTDPQPPAFYKKDDQLYLPNYKETIMPKAGGVGLHVIVIIGIMFLGLSALVLLEICKGQFT